MVKIYGKRENSVARIMRLRKKEVERTTKVLDVEPTKQEKEDLLGRKLVYVEKYQLYAWQY